MNTLDLFDYEVTKSPTPKPSEPASPEPSSHQSASSSSAASITSEPTLEEEVSQALGQLGRFWGGFRAQSQSAFNLARKDLGQVVSQARAEIGKIANEVSASAAPRSSISEESPESVTPKGKGKEKEVPPSESSSEPLPSPPASGSLPGNLFSRLQSQLPPNLQPSAIAATLSTATSSAAAAAPTVDIASLRNTIATNLQKAQSNLPLAQAEKLAEGYLAKSQDLFKEAGEFFKDAIKVVPPSESGHDDSDMTFSVSGTDVWLFPSPIGTKGWGGEDEKPDETPRAGRGGRDILFSTQMSRATRAEALLRRLKHDPEMIRLDPSNDGSIATDFTEFEKEIETKGGIDSDEMTVKISEVLKAGANGEVDGDAKALIDNRDLLVPNELSNEVFWTRYFFRIQQISRDEDKRKALLTDATQASEEDFSWEDDEDEVPPSASSTQPPVASALPRSLSNHALQTLGSPRLSSEASYDLVGDSSAAGTRGQSPVRPEAQPQAPTQVSAVSKEEGSTPKEKPATEEEEEDDDDDDEDSDWE